MTLVITGIAAIIATIVLYAKPVLAQRFHIGVLALMYWGASLMWCVDGFATLAEGEGFIELSDAVAMSDDALLGVCVVVLGLVVWGIVCAVKNRKSNTAAAA